MAGESAFEVARRSREKAQRLQKHAEMYERGAEGEILTAQVLTGLPAGWTVMHDLRWPGRQLANIDHIVVGPGGIFVIDSKNWSGRITIADAHLRQNGRSRERATTGVTDAALAVAGVVPRFAHSVSAALCFVGEHEVAGWCGDVMICSIGNLTQMLLTRPQILSPEQVTEAWLCLDAAMGKATTSTARSRRPAARPLPVTTRSTRRRSDRPRSKRRRTSLVTPLMGLLMILGLVTVGPQLATAAGGWMSQTLARNMSVPPANCAKEQPKHPLGANEKPGRVEHRKSASVTAQGADC